jgi:hypothetical protein
MLTKNRAEWLLGGGAIALFLVCSACTNIAGHCGNEVLKETASPDGKMKAVIFQRDCGATTGFSTQVSILFEDEKLPDEGGNAFTADTNHGEAPSGQGGGPVVEVSWLSDNELLIKHDRRARALQPPQSPLNVRILYETFAK